MARPACAEPEDRPPEQAPDDPRQIDSHALFGDSRVLVIRHGGDLYRLRITRAEKLILTK